MQPVISYVTQLPLVPQLYQFHQSCFLRTDPDPIQVLSQYLYCPIYKVRNTYKRFYIGFVESKDQQVCSRHFVQVQSLVSTALKNIYFTLLFLVVKLLALYSIKYSLNYSSIYPVKNNPAYATWSTTIDNFIPLCLIFSFI